VVSERLSMPISGVAPELRRRERNSRLIGLALLIPAAALALLFLYYPLLFILQMSFTEGSSFLSSAGPVQTVDNYRLIVERYLPNLFVTIQLALLATIVDLVLGFPFAYILVRREHSAKEWRHAEHRKQTRGEMQSVDLLRIVSPGEIRRPKLSGREICEAPRLRAPIEHVCRRNGISIVAQDDDEPVAVRVRERPK